MRHVLLAFALVAGCAFDPSGPGPAVDDTDAPPAADVDAARTADPDAADLDAAPSTTTDAAVSLPDASLPLPDASTADATPPPDAAPPPDASPPDAGPITELACTNGEDDDDDGKVDCRDDDCPGCGGLSSCCPSGACALLCL